MANEPRGYLKPGVKDPKFLRDKNNGQFSNAPLYMELGGAKSKEMLQQTKDSGNLSLEKNGPTAKRGRPF